MITVYAHITGLENTMMEIEELPAVTDTVIIGKNPRKRDGKDLEYLIREVNTVVYPLSSIVFLEVIPTGEEDEFESFIRE